MNKFTVLGILGPAGSGKDLVADYLCTNGFVKIAFADPMKRFARGAFGLTTEQLWGPSEERNREFEVDEAWWFNAIGNMPQAFDEILNMVLQDGDRSRGYLALMDWFSKLRQNYREKISARLILQTLGTEWGRTVDPLLWARYAHKVAGRVGAGGGYSQENGWTSIGARRWDGVVIPDHRFINEVELSQGFGAYVMRLRRLAREEAPTVGIAGHQSESEQKMMTDESFDVVLELEEFWLDEVDSEGNQKYRTPDIESFHRALEPILKEEAWKRGKGTRVRVSPRS